MWKSNMAKVEKVTENSNFILPPADCLAGVMGRQLGLCDSQSNLG
jgi:hypothetical protein